MKYLRYKGSFRSLAGVLWDVQIWQENGTPFPNPGELRFDADTPLQLEWGDREKEAVLCGSTATLNIISMSDREYVDLYSIEPGRVRLDVYREGSLYWSGTIDTEFYEEPYESASGYTVPLTFSDFGLLDRLKFNAAGMIPVSGLVRMCIARSQIKTIFTDQTMISTSLEKGGRPMSLDDICVMADNFYDEDGEAMSLEEVLEGVLQPLGLKVIQRAGSVYVFDLNGLYTAGRKGTPELIRWYGDNSTMGTDKVYNNARITWSTYAQEGNLLPDKCWSEDITADPNLIALDNAAGVQSPDGLARYFSYTLTTEPGEMRDEGQCGFTLWVSDTGRNVAEKNNLAKFFRIVPQNDGTEAEGIALRYVGVEYSKNVQFPPQIIATAYGYGEHKENTMLHNSDRPGSLIFEMPAVHLPPADDTGALILKLKQEVLGDWRVNPFEDDVDNGTRDHEIEEKKWANAYINFLYIPVVITYRPQGSSKVYVWDNRAAVLRSVEAPVTTLTATEGEWHEYTETNGKPDAWAYLAFYDLDDRKEKCALRGWKTNRPAINPNTEKLTSMLENFGAGQLIKYPAAGTAAGDLEIKVYDGAWRMQDGGANITAEDYDPKGMWQRLNFLLMKLPQIEILNNRKFELKINTDDVEYKAALNAGAKETIEIDTICGSSKETVPTARGAYFYQDTGRQIKEFTRAGRTSQVEDLLIGTLYSQYATRHTTLRGEAKILTGAVATYSEYNQSNKIFICTQDTQNVAEDTSDATFIELSADEYVNQTGR